MSLIHRRQRIILKHIFLRKGIKELSLLIRRAEPVHELVGSIFSVRERWILAQVSGNFFLCFFIHRNLG